MNGVDQHVHIHSCHWLIGNLVVRQRQNRLPSLRRITVVLISVNHAVRRCAGEEESPIDELDGEKMVYALLNDRRKHNATVTHHNAASKSGARYCACRGIAVHKNEKKRGKHA